MMGRTPREIDALTLPEMAAMVDGFRRFHAGPGADEGGEPDLDAFYAARAEAMEAGRL